MGSGRGRTWDWAIAVAGLVLIVALFLHWYRSNGDNWRGLSYLGISGKLIFLAGLLAIAAPIVANRRPTPGRVQQYTLIVLGFAVLAVALTIFRMADPPEFDTLNAPVTLKPGAWIALVASISIVVLALVAMRARVVSRPARSTAETAT